MQKQQGKISLIPGSPTAVLEIDQPERRNALNEAMWQAIPPLLEQVEEDRAIRVLVVRGAGDRAFSAGADISEFGELARSPERIARNQAIIQGAQQRLEALMRPTVAAVRGACFGGGCGLALACDLRIVADDAVFALTPARLGLAYSLADTRRLHRLAGPGLCREMLYTGRRLDAAEALERGLVNQVVPAAELEQAVQELAGELAAASQYSIRGIKQVLAYIEGWGGCSESELARISRDAFAGDDCREGAAAFLEKREPRFRWG